MTSTLIRAPLPTLTRGPAPAPARLLDPRRLEATDLAAWQQLEDRALEPNAYLSPHFVLPALRHLDPALRVRLVVAEQGTGTGTSTGRRWLGVGLWHPQAPARHLPLPHLAGYQSRHSYLGHWLLDRDHAVDAAQALLRALRQQHRWAAALALPLCPLDGPLQATLAAAAQRLGGALSVGHRQARAMLAPAQGGPALLRAQLGAKQHANQERCKRRLREQGELGWHLLRGCVDGAAIETFLDLEHSGWKRDEGTSLRAQPDDEAFFRAMAQGFMAAGRALFTELRLAGRPIASTANLVSGDMGFAFKVGWDESLRKLGVGLLNEAAFVEHAPTACADLRLIDSGAQPASFIDTLWPLRRELGTLQIALHAPGRIALAALDQLRQHRQRRLQRLQRRADAQPTP